ncbi:hypothetical protein JTB14_026261 [Gonioctena quinquepunctata]|nr:hypothetical protein JTB14_026261 [Gonioctena quinquepunctata]
MDKKNRRQIIKVKRGNQTTVRGNANPKILVPRGRRKGFKISPSKSQTPKHFLKMEARGPGSPDPPRDPKSPGWGAQKGQKFPFPPA